MSQTKEHNNSHITIPDTRSDDNFRSKRDTKCDNRYNIIDIEYKSLTPEYRTLPEYQGFPNKDYTEYISL